MGLLSHKPDKVPMLTLFLAAVAYFSTVKVANKKWFSGKKPMRVDPVLPKGRNNNSTKAQ